MRSSYKDILDFKVFDCTAKEDKVNQFLALLQDPDIKPVLNLYLENFLATSELKILKRLAALEQVMGLNNMDLSEEHELTIPEQLNILAARIDNTQVINKPPVEPENSPVTKTENRAYLLVEKLKSLRSKKFLDSREIVQFLKHGIEERYRVKEGQNARQAKKECLEKAAELFPYVSLDKKKHGRREVRLILQPSDDHKVLQTIQRTPS
jgi:hypothetical protein